MFNIIVACDENGGIGKNGKLPWNIKDELKIFRETTQNSLILFGMNTINSIPPLKNREIVVISKIEKHPLYRTFSSFKEFLQFAKESNKKIFIGGGGKLYSYVFRKYSFLIDKVYLSIIHSTYECDTFLNYDKKEWCIENEEKHELFTFYTLRREIQGENQYLSLLEKLSNNNLRTGRNGLVRSSFVNHLSFDLRNGFPLLTTKKMFFRGIIEELLFFLRGNTNSKLLESKKINIWKENTSREFLDSNNFENRNEGVMGPMYGYQWRFFNAKYDEQNACPLEPGFDQLKTLIYNIKENPESRRLLLTDYNPLQAHLGVLYPCHSIIMQFYVVDEFLDVFCFNRSSDVFLGLPFNIASTSLFLHIISFLVNKTPRFVNISLGDTHIYDVHMDSVKKQLTRIPYVFPTLNLNITNFENLDDTINNMNVSNFTLINYKSHDSIFAPMVK